MKRCMTCLVTAVVASATFCARAGSLEPTHQPGERPMPSLEHIASRMDWAETAVVLDVKCAPYVSSDRYDYDQMELMGYTYRPGIPWPHPRFLVGTGAASNVVTDLATGLMWVKNQHPTKMNATNAIQYCEALDGSEGRGGYTDWRLPNILELSSLIDFGRRYPALPEGHPFTGISNLFNYVWSSTLLIYKLAESDTGYPRLLRLYFSDGSISADSSSESYVWPVRGGGP